jgi:ABC-type Fe3+/spermidine/putrescine transport system ATPase subunit
VASVSIEELAKSYGTNRAVEIPTLTIADGEFFSLLGPSGCGKTTTLRCIAGTVEADRGRIVIGDRDVTSIPTYRRNLGMVIQQYALFPHLTVRENVDYGLEGRGLPAAARAARVRESLDLVALGGLDQRYPHQLSGGQKQRVAVARAIAYRPDVLLLDEPFSSLDVKLRTMLRGDLRQLQQALGITTVFVTHDQQEALALSDRIAVMHAGRVEQVGTPEEIYERPLTALVADFVGGTNLLLATISDARDGRARARIDGQGTIEVALGAALPAGAAVTLMVKPERIRLRPDDGTSAALTGELAAVSYVGSGYSYSVDIGSQRIEVRRADPALVSGRRIAPGERVAIEIDPDAVRVVPS